MEESRLKRFFLKGRGANAGQVRVRPEIADMVRYDTLNLLAPSWPINEKFDAIFCRNVMIYFDKPTQARILERFVPLLKPGGLLFAGHSENFTYISQDFRLRGQTVYECGAGPSSPRRQKCRKSESLCGRFRAGARPDDRDHQQPAGHGGRRDRARSAGARRSSATTRMC